MHPTVRFVIVGGINTTVGLLTIWLLKWLGGLSDFTANLGGYALGVCVSFLLNRSWTFSFKGAWLPSIARFLVVVAVAYLANLGVVLLLAQKFGVNGYLAQMFGVPPYTILFYLGSRYFAFRPIEAATCNPQT
jgi:putative flippase GtrA